MSIEWETTVVLRDPSGECYAVPRAVLDRYRLAPAERAEVEARLAEAEVAGYVYNPLHPDGGASQPTSPTQPPSMLGWSQVLNTSWSSTPIG